MAREMKDSGIDWIKEIPIDWKTSKIKHEFINLDGKRKPIDAELRNKDGDVLYDYYGASGVIDQIDSYIYDDELILIGEDGANLVMRNLPLIYIASGKFWVNNHAHVLKPTERNQLKFMAYYLESVDLTNFITGSTQPKLSQANLNIIPVIVPSIKEQKEIAEHLDQKVSQIDSIITQTKQSIEEYRKYKQSLITEVVTKGLDPNVKMKDSGIEWIGEIPEHWKVKKLKYVLKEISEKSIDGLEEPLSMNQKKGIIRSCDENIPNPKTSYVGNKIVSIDDLVFNKLKAHLGVFAVSKYEGIVSPDYAVYRTLNGYNAKYLEYLFKTSVCINEFKKYIRGVGAGLSRLYTGDLFALYMPLPSKEEQDEILDFIDTKSNEMDILISKKEVLVTELEAYKKSLIYEVVTGKKEVS